MVARWIGSTWKGRSSCVSATIWCRTDRAFYQRADDTVVSPGAVVVTGEGLSLSGDRMTVEMGSQRVRFEGKVRTTLKRAEEGADAGTS